MWESEAKFALSHQLLYVDVAGQARVEPVSLDQRVGEHHGERLVIGQAGRVVRVGGQGLGATVTPKDKKEKEKRSTICRVNYVSSNRAHLMALVATVSASTAPVNLLSAL